MREGDSKYIHFWLTTSMQYVVFLVAVWLFIVWLVIHRNCKIWMTKGSNGLATRCKNTGHLGNYSIITLLSNCRIVIAHWRLLEIRSLINLVYRQRTRNTINVILLQVISSLKLSVVKAYKLLILPPAYWWELSI